MQKVALSPHFSMTKGQIWKITLVQYPKEFTYEVLYKGLWKHRMDGWKDGYRGTDEAATICSLFREHTKEKLLVASNFSFSHRLFCPDFNPFSNEKFKTLPY